MAYNAYGLTAISILGAVGTGPGNVKTLYGYGTNDTKATVEGSGYFNAEVEKLKVGDVMIVAGDLDGTPYNAIYTVSSNNGTTVGLTELSSITQNVTQEVFMPKISTKASDAEVYRYVANFDGSITKVRSVLNAALATGDATIQLKINGTNVTNGLLTATQSGSAAGDVDVATPSAANTFVAGDVITAVVAGSSTATATANLTVQLTPA